jgi:hypothetical protein
MGTGIWLFLLSQGLASSEGLVSTLGMIIHTPAAKSLHNFVEVAAPHMFAMGSLFFVAAHFMLFSTKISQRTSLIVAMFLFAFLLFDIFSYGLLSSGMIDSGWIKLLSMALFVGMFLILLGMLAISL